MPSPPKPWERTTNTNGSSRLTSTPLTAEPVSLDGTTAPAVPARPSTMSSNTAVPAINRGYGAYGSGAYGSGAYGSGAYGSGAYSSGYSPYSTYGGMNSYNSHSGYSPYNRYGTYSSGYSPYSRYSSYGGGGYSGYGSYGYNRYGTGGMMGGPNGPINPEEIPLTQRMEASTSAGFHMIESVVNAFGGFASMLESTFFATHSSFMAMVGVVEQFGNLRNYLGQILSVFALARWLRKIFYKLTGRAPPVNPNEITSVHFEQFQDSRRSRRPLFFFLLAIIGIPYAIHKIIQILLRRYEAKHMINTPIPASSFPDETQGQMIKQSTTSGAVSPQNLEFCRALYDFQAESPVELSFKRGEIIAILSKTDAWGQPSEWWRGRVRNGSQGLFPSNYVEIINKGGGSISGDSDTKNPVQS
ncbi:4024_t:CDS:2 [Ambispora leptoticha]|uniref:Peroxisomal membrane protein PEX13 n=1 Tax=Ambispora leptoticha TaxID=144679 RepID=A0A9N8YWN3_9GLOM|nr:4024_t:CDS:2 [Ambispora leptoticha]